MVSKITLLQRTVKYIILGSFRAINNIRKIKENDFFNIVLHDSY